MVLKKADYEIPELGLHIQNETFKVTSVDRYENPPRRNPNTIKFRYDRARSHRISLRYPE